MAQKCPEADNWCEFKLGTTKTSFRCTIDNFSQCTEKTGEKLDSSTFSADKESKTKWFLCIYPNGDKEESKGFVSLFLCLKGSDREEVAVSYQMAIINSKDQIYNEFEGKHSFRRGCCWGWPQFISRSLLNTQNEELLPNDRLTIYCEVTTTGERRITSGQRTEIKPKKTLTDDMTALFLNMNDSDIEFSVNGHPFRAHKIIVKTRCPLLAAMFDHSIRGNRQNRVIIEDIEKKVFHKVLQFIYTDKYQTEDIDTDIKVFSAADKYNLEELKSICEQNIELQVNVETVSDVLIIADNQSAEEIKSKAIEFIKSNLNKVKKTKGWKKVMESTDLLNSF